MLSAVSNGLKGSEVSPYAVQSPRFPVARGELTLGWARSAESFGHRSTGNGKGAPPAIRVVKPGFGYLKSPEFLPPRTGLLAQFRAERRPCWKDIQGHQGSLPYADREWQPTSERGSRL